MADIFDSNTTQEQTPAPYVRHRRSDRHRPQAEPPTDVPQETSGETPEETKVMPPVRPGRAVSQPEPTRVMPAVGGERSVRRETSFDPLTRSGATPGGVPP